MARQRGAASRAIGNDLQVFIEETLVEHLLQLPPHRLDVGGVEGPIRPV